MSTIAHPHRLRFPTAALLLALAVSACGVRNNSIFVGQDAIPASSLPVEERMGTVPGRLEYLLQAGDSIDVKFFYNPELNESVVIRPDGAISLPLVGQVTAAGKTPDAFNGELKERYRPMLRRPEVVVIVRKYGAQRVYVSGEVLNPGPVSLEGTDLTALQAIMAVGGFRYSAARSSVVLLRNEGTGQPKFIKLDLQAHLEQRSVEDLKLRPYDIVFVPQTDIGEVAQFFDQYVNRIVPLYRNLGFFFTYGVRSDQTVTVTP
jgi:protein involved in polysaccharide export with SLBB domain